CGTRREVDAVCPLRIGIQRIRLGALETTCSDRAAWLGRGAGSAKCKASTSIRPRAVGRKVGSIVQVGEKSLGLVCRRTGAARNLLQQRNAICIGVDEGRCLFLAIKPGPLRS